MKKRSDSLYSAHPTAHFGLPPTVYPRLRKRHRLLNLLNRLTRIQPLRTSPGAIQDRMAPVQAHRIIQRRLPRLRALISRINQPPVRLQQYCRPQVFLGIPPVRGARRGAAGAKDALVEAVEFFALFGGLTVFEAVGGFRVSLEVGLDGFVLLVEVSEVGDEVFNNVGVGEGVDAGFVGSFSGNAACICLVRRDNEKGLMVAYKGRPAY